MEICKYKLHFNNFFTIDCVGKSCGLALLWKGDLCVSIQSFSNNHIDALVKEGDRPEWKFTGVYGNPKAANRYMTRNLIRQINSGGKCPWLVGVILMKYYVLI